MNDEFDLLMENTPSSMNPVNGATQSANQKQIYGVINVSTTEFSKFQILNLEFFLNCGLKFVVEC